MYRHHDLLVFEVSGTGFLWHQVRCMMAVLFLVGMGLEQPQVRGRVWRAVGVCSCRDWLAVKIPALAS